MKKSLVILLLAISSTWANTDFSYILGMRNNRYAFAGVEYKNKIGVVVENSVMAQGVEKQYVRIVPFYEWALPLGLRGVYGIFAGLRYDRDYHDYGAILEAEWNIYERYLIFHGAFHPFFDSYLGSLVGYEFAMASFFAKEVGIYMGLKNLPDFRDVERRAVVGILFDTGTLFLKPELSLPTNGDTHLVRMGVFFIYKSHF